VYQQGFLSVDGHQQECVMRVVIFIVCVGELVNFSGEAIFKVCGMHVCGGWFASVFRVVIEEGVCVCVCERERERERFCD